MRTRALLIATVLAAGGAAPAFAQATYFNGGNTDYRPNAALGSSQDVQSSVSSLSKQFGKIDISRNGLITRGEWGAAGMFAPDFDKLDYNRDGKVALEEWSAGLAGSSNVAADRKRSK